MNPNTREYVESLLDKEEPTDQHALHLPRRDQEPTDCVVCGVQLTDENIFGLCKPLREFVE